MKKVLLSCAEVAEMLNNDEDAKFLVKSKNLQEMMRRRGFDPSGTSGKTYLYKPSEFLEAFKGSKDSYYYDFAVESLSNSLSNFTTKSSQLEMEFNEDKVEEEVENEELSLEDQIRKAFNEGNVRLVSGLVFNEKIYTIFHSPRGFNEVKLGPVLDVEHWNTSNCPEEYDNAEEVLKTAIRVFSGTNIEFKKE